MKIKPYTIIGYKMNYLKKLLLNLAILTSEVGLVWLAYNTFTHKFEPLVGALSVIITLSTTWFLIHLSRKKGFRYQRPGMIKTTLVIIALLVICTFAGIQPMAEWKDKAADKITITWSNWQEEQEQNRIEEEARQAEEKVIEEERIRQQEAEQEIINEQNRVEQEQEKQDKLFEMEHEVVVIVNLIRSDRGTQMLQWDDNLYEYSKQHSMEMGKVGYMFHTDMYQSYAENCWWGSGSNWEAMDIVESWMTSEKHRTWLLCPSLKHVAVGIVYSDTGTYASWTFWRNEPVLSDWWYQYSPDNPPEWWY